MTHSLSASPEARPEAPAPTPDFEPEVDHVEVAERALQKLRASGITGLILPVAPDSLAGASHLPAQFDNVAMIDQPVPVPKIEIPLKSKEHARPRKSPSGPDLRFSFRIANARLLLKTYSPHQFAALEPLERILIGIGSSASFLNEREKQDEHIAKLLKKGCKPADYLNKEEVERITNEAIKNGLVDDSGDLRQLTAKAGDVLLPRGDKQQKKAKADKLPPQEAPEPEGYLAAIPNPYRFDDEPLSESLVEHIEDNIPGYRQSQVLAELELAGGELIAKKPWAEIRKRCGLDNSSSGTYKKSLDRLATIGHIDMQKTDDPDSDITVSLTPTGWSVVEHLRNNPHLVRGKEAKTRNFMGSGFRIVEWVAERTNWDTSVWVNPPGSSTMIINQLENEFSDLKEEALARRFYDLHTDRGYLEIEQAESDDAAHSGKTTINVRLTQRGLDFLKDTIEKTRLKDDMVDDDSLWLVDTMTDTCRELATKLGRHKIVQELSDARNERHLAEMTSGEFEDEELRITMLLEKLRKDYASQFGRQ
jgi:DNA-binding MarR family transcriptional regulator